MSNLDLRELRNAFGSFMTGVTVVTTHQPDGTPRGFTANSFTSVSLDPPLLIVCIGKFADSFSIFENSNGFAINILAENQAETSGVFASKRPDKFDVTPWKDGPAGHPVLNGVSAWFDCSMEQVIDAGDHAILMGRVQAFDHNTTSGLGFVRGGYMNLELEQDVIGAAGNKAIVGAVVECDERVLLVRDSITGLLHPPATGQDETVGSISRLKGLLNEIGVSASITSLYSVFENEVTGQQSIYYRAIADESSSSDLFYSKEDIPWDELPDSAMRTMIRRYFNELSERRFGVYFGSNVKGNINILDNEDGDI